MRTVYNIESGFLGESMEIELGQPAPAGWTFTTPPNIPFGKYAKWEGDWVLVSQEEAQAAAAAHSYKKRESQANSLIASIDAKRDSSIAKGKLHTFPDGIIGTVQLRHERDRGNVNAVATAGMALIASESTDKVSFRDAEDVTHLLTGQEAIQFGLAVMQWVSSQYAAAWAHKDAIRLLLETDGDLSTYDLDQGWPTT